MKKCDLIGQRFGLLTVLERTENRKDRYALWRCACDCGKEKDVSTKDLKRGTIKNCGCIPKSGARKGPILEELAGRTFGKLTVVERAENRGRRTCWLCRCECGTEKVVAAHDLKSGNSRSCGCGKYDNRNYLDIKGQRFGRLEAIAPTSNRDKKFSIFWNCVCDCGKEVEVTADRLLYGNYRSCGCLKRENQKTIFAKLHMVDGTCVEWLEKRKYRSDNTSGFRGVYQMKNGSYRVSIGFKGERFHVGTFKSYREAVDARIEVERLLHDGFVKAYYIWKQKAELEPAWKENNPFVYNVTRNSGDFSVNVGAGLKRAANG